MGVKWKINTIQVELAKLKLADLLWSCWLGLDKVFKSVFGDEFLGVG